MATGAPKRLEEHLTCSMCLETYTNPKQLQCNHVYCQLCLERLVVRDQQGKLVLACPICRQVTPIDATRGVASLQSAFHINDLLEIQDSIDRSKKTALSSFESSTSEVAITLSMRSLHLLKWKDVKGNEHKFSLMDQVSAKWPAFGLRLHLTRNQLDGMDSRSRGDPDTCWTKVMEFWLSGEGGEEYPATWEGLCTLLEDVQRGTVAEKLREILSELSALKT